MVITKNLMVRENKMKLKKLRLIKGPTINNIIEIDPLEIEEINFKLYKLEDMIEIKTLEETYELKRTNILWVHWQYNLKLLRTIFDIEE